MARIINGSLYVESYVSTGNPGEWSFVDAVYNNQADATGNGAHDITVGFVLYVPASDINTAEPIPGVLHRYVITDITPAPPGDTVHLTATIKWDERDPTEIDQPLNGSYAAISEPTQYCEYALPPTTEVYPELPGGSAEAAYNTDIRDITDYGSFSGSGGITGLPGPTGSQGVTGPLGAGYTGLSGVTGLPGPTGPSGVTGSVGAGYTGLPGATGLPGSNGVTGAQGTTGAASSVIGTAESGGYTGGLFVDFISTTPIGTAVDRFNEVLKFLAPSPAPALSNIGITNTGVAGKLSFGSSNAIAGYTNVPSKDINSAVGVSESITDGADTVVLKGIFNAATVISGNLADTVTQGPGSPTPAYPARAFGEATTGSIQLWLNDVQVASIDLTSSSGALSDSNASAVLNVSAAESVKFPDGNDFVTFKYRTGTWQINAAGQRNGYNRVHVTRVTSSSVITNVYGWVVDASTTATSFASEALSGLSMAGSKYLSGVNYHTSGSATYGVTISNPHRNTYSSSASAVSHTTTRCSVSSSALGNIATEADTDVVSKTATVSTGSRILNQNMLVTTTVDRTVQSDLTSTGVNAFALLLDATASSSSATSEGFDDEVYRIASNLNINTTAGYSSSGSSPSEWDGTISLASATAGYSDGLLVYNSALRYPTQGANGGNFSGIADGPLGNVNYSGVT